MTASLQKTLSRKLRCKKLKTYLKIDAYLQLISNFVLYRGTQLGIVCLILGWVLAIGLG